MEYFGGFLFFFFFPPLALSRPDFQLPRRANFSLSPVHRVNHLRQRDSFSTCIRTYIPNLTARELSRTLKLIFRYFISSRRRGFHRDNTHLHPLTRLLELLSLHERCIFGPRLAPRFLTFQVQTYLSNFPNFVVFRIKAKTERCRDRQTIAYILATRRFSKVLFSKLKGCLKLIFRTRANKNIYRVCFLR